MGGHGFGLALMAADTAGNPVVEGQDGTHAVLGGGRELLLRFFIFALVAVLAWARIHA